ncbi:MAG: S8 family peptidase [Bacteriovorax sp.]|nr:S8 family peptidase [Bacteriovorax sp.]
MKFFLSMLLLFSFHSAMAQSKPNDLIVKLKPGFSLPKLKNVKNVQNLFENVYVLRTKNLELLEAELKNNSTVLYIERNFKSERKSLPIPFTQENIKSSSNLLDSQFNDPQIGKIWAFNDADKFGISVNTAYKTYGTSNTTPVIVAVVDTGVDVNHEDLKDIIWINKNEIPNNGIDDDGNGYIDDINGINTLVRDSNGKATVNIKDTHSHGTHVSGTVAAKQNNGVGIAGIASNVKIMGIRTVPNDGDESDVDVAEAFIYAARNGARIINCSFGKSANEGRQLIPDTLKYIGEKYGVLVIAAAGNDSSNIDKNLTYPASFNNDNLLIIASTTDSGKMSYFSNYGKINVDVAAPGSDIYSTVPGNKYAYMSGTSMATPTTVGVAAEILAHNPNLTVSQLKDVLIKSVTKISSFQTKMVSGGRIDLLNGLELARTIK